VPALAATFGRSPGQTRAVVLVHGLRWRDILASQMSQAAFEGWQQPDSALVRTLKADADVFAFAYGQNVVVDRIARSAALADNIRRIRQIGYEQIILVGHSAGGVVVRQFMEDQPNAGVTKVIQVGAPNGGSDWGKGSPQPFIDSLTKQQRMASLQGRSDKLIPAGVEFVCVISGAFTDGVVLCACQWTEDLQRQGIPAVALNKNHHNAIASQEGANLIGQLVREKLPRWDAAKVATEKRKFQQTGSARGSTDGRDLK
jgi:pimeloyl-ACP methyl ester carboxylesterase